MTVDSPPSRFILPRGVLRPLGALAVLFFAACAAARLPPPATGVEPPPLVEAGGGALLRLIVVGDFGDGADTVFPGIARVHREHPADAVLILGDNFYPCGVASETDARWDSIRATFSTLGIPLYPVLGNHDYGEPQFRDGSWRPCQSADPAAQLRAAALVPHWIFPARSYLLRSAVADVAMVDTSPIAYGFDAPTLGGDSWAEGVKRLELAIGTMQQSGDNRWRIVAGHHTIVSSGFHGRVPSSEKSRMRGLMSILRAGDVDLYLCGHDHDLELVSGKPLFLVSGSGSAPRPMVALMLRTLFPADTRKRFGFAVIELTARALAVTFYDAAGEPYATPFTFTKHRRPSH
jgi:tartrate-resistant acid phosphatase type 5